METREDFIEFEEKDEQDAIAYMTEFREKIFPVYQRLGFTFPEAFTCHQLQVIKNTLGDIANNAET